MSNFILDQIDLERLEDDDALEAPSHEALIAELEQAQETMVTIADMIRFCVSKLKAYDVVVAQGTDDPFAEGSAMVLHPLSLAPVPHPEILPCRLTASEKSAILALLKTRILERKPLSYLINLAYFCDLPFYVDERVLIPRSPIAELIKSGFYPYFAADNTPDDAFDHGLYDSYLPTPERILDLCTGSGCIAIALAKAFADAMVDAVDVDEDALEVAALNVEHHRLLHQINLIKSDLFAKLPKEAQYDLIVTNPPYVDAAIMADLPPEFVHEPALALAAGQDGLDIVHKILYLAPLYLSRDGLLVCEVGESEWALKQAYPHIQFDWLKFEKGPGGVFAITSEELLEYRDDFAKFAEV